MHTGRLITAIAILCCILIPWLGSVAATSCRSKEICQVVQEWRRKPTIRAANHLVDSKILLNQSPEAVEKLIGRSAITIDPKRNPQTGKTEETRWHSVGRATLVLTYVDGKLFSAWVSIPNTRHRTP